MKIQGQSTAAMAIIVLVVVFAAVLLVWPKTDESGAQRALDASGYTSVRFTGYRWFMCGKDDTYSTGFEAVGPTGQRVTGSVCAGFWKGSTIRLD